MTTWETALVALLVGVLSSVITMAVKTFTDRKFMEKAIADHVAQCHQTEIYAVVKTEIREHSDHCPSAKLPEEMAIVKTALIFLVTKMGGNLKEIGLA